MPEGAEIRVMADQMNKLLAGTTMIRFSIMNGPYLSNPKPRYADLRKQAAALNKRIGDHSIKIDYVRNKGKYIYIQLSTVADGKKLNSYILCHVGMAGHWRMDQGDHTMVMIQYRKNDEPHVLYYDDYRRFGNFYITNAAGVRQKLSELGPDVLSKEFTLAAFRDILADPHLQKRRIGELLMDQSVVSGVGNYMRADILYMCKLSPHRTVASLSVADRAALYKSIVHVSSTSYAQNGTTIATYRDVNAEKGDYVPVIYGKTTDPKGNPIKTETLSGRTMHWVPAIQK